MPSTPVSAFALFGCATHGFSRSWEKGSWQRRRYQTEAFLSYPTEEKGNAHCPWGIGSGQRERLCTKDRKRSFSGYEDIPLLKPILDLDLQKFILQGT
jgi:hypothetical protein